MTYQTPERRLDTAVIGGGRVTSPQDEAPHLRGRDERSAQRP